MIRGFRDASGTVHRLDYDSLENKPDMQTIVGEAVEEIGVVTTDMVATDDSVGVVKVDGDTIKVNESGQIYVDISDSYGVRF